MRTILPNIKRRKKAGVQVEYMGLIAMVVMTLLKSLKSYFTGYFAFLLIGYIGGVVFIMLLPSSTNHGKKFYEQIIIYLKFKAERLKEEVSKI